MSVTNINIPIAQSFLLVDTRTGPNKVLFLPAASTIQGRFLSIKDYYGNATKSTVTISTTGFDRIDQRGIYYTLASSFGSVMLLSDGMRSWNMLGLYEGGDTALSMVAAATITYSSVNLVITNASGVSWKATANNQGYANYSIGLNSGTPMSFNIYAGSDVYNSANGRVALLYNGDTNNAVRHAGYVMWTYTFVANNYDFGWYFVSSGSGYLIYNDYPSIGSAWQVSYDSASDRVLIVAPGDSRYGMVWYITPNVTLSYVHTSYPT
jgi:hypothetical protein